MKIFANGEHIDCGGAQTIEELVRHHEFSPETTLVERNGLALRRRDWDQILQENDRIEILCIAAGG